MKRSEIVDYILNGIQAKGYPCWTEVCKNTACITCVENQLAEYLYEVKETSKREAYQDVYDRIDEGVCEFCSHNGEPRCFVTCSGYDYEKETIMKWLKEKAGEKN